MSAAALVDGEYPLTAEDFGRLADMLRADAGIHLPRGKATLVYSRLAKRLRALGLSDFGEYCTLVAGPDGAAERGQMISALTTNVTRFFREPHHFDHLRKAVLPGALADARRGARVRIWSSASSSGQEPYSIALTILDLVPDAASLDIRILATDIDPAMVAATTAGRYPASVLSDLPAPMRERWFGPTEMNDGEPQRRIADAARALVVPRQLNLIGGWPMTARYAAIFCRNVAIYFDDETQRRLWPRFAPLLPPGGALYIGHSERLPDTATRFFETDGVTTYRRVEDAR